MKRIYQICIFLASMIVLYFARNLIINYAQDYQRTVILGGNTIGIHPSISSNSNNLSTSGIIGAGTITYVDPITNEFGALGHSYTSTGNVIATETIGTIKNGNEIGYKIVKGQYNQVIGSIIKNSNVGVYGKYNNINNTEMIELGMPKEIKKGIAYIYTEIDASGPKYYEIKITGINMLSIKTNLYFTVTDESLLSITDGLIKGMSGSPIIQNGKLVGSLSSVNKKNFKKGYGVFITNMINNA